MKEQIKQRKYERTFILVASIVATLMNNLPYYSLYLYSSDKYKGPEQTIWETVSKLSWYTLQCFLSVLILSLVNYYLMKVVFPKISKSITKFIVIITVNLILAFIMFKVTYFLAGQTIGYAFGEKWAINYYIWKYIYVTPIAVLLAYMLNLIVLKRVVEGKNEKLKQENLSNQLKTLKDQIKPHFLFNTLNTLSSIIRNDSRDSGLSFVNDLAIVYRYILEKSNEDIVRITEEIEFAISYIRILEKRFHKAISVNIEIPDKYMNYNIPPSTMLLLIENALKHNEFSKSKPLKVDIFMENHFIVVQNNTLDKKQKSDGLGIGLQNLNLRYNILADREIIISRKDGLFTVKLPIIK